MKPVDSIQQSQDLSRSILFSAYYDLRSFIAYQRVMLMYYLRDVFNEMPTEEEKMSASTETTNKALVRVDSSYHYCLLLIDGQLE